MQIHKSKPIPINHLDTDSALELISVEWRKKTALISKKQEEGKHLASSTYKSELEGYIEAYKDMAWMMDNMELYHDCDTLSDILIYYN